MKIRPCAESDEDAVVRLWTECGLVVPWNDPRQDIRRKLKVQAEMFLVGCLGGEVVATVMAGYEGHRGWINYLAVHPGHRRAGIGRRMMEEAERSLRAAGCPKINLQVRSGNAAAIDFYKRIGFKQDDVVSLGKRPESEQQATATDRIPSPFELTTERLLIRSPHEDDAGQLREAIEESLDALKPWMPWAERAPTPDEARENCRRAEQAFREGTDHRLHLFLKDTRTFVGGSGLHRIDWSVPKCEIGYWVRTSCIGRGYITEAVRAIARFAMDDLGVRRVEIRMSTGNTRSRRVPERLGFVCEGILRNEARNADGTLRDTCVYVLIKEDHGKPAGGRL